MAKDNDQGQGMGTDVTEFSKEEIVRAVDQKWIDAISAVSMRVETAGSGHVEVYRAEGLYSVDAEATLRHFLEVTCNIRVAPDHSGHKVPTGPGKGHDQTRGVTGANQPEAKPLAPRTRFAR